MTTTPSQDAPPSTSMTDAEYGALRASAALWAGTSVLITDERGRVLIQRVDYRTTCLLPGGAVDANESPAQGAARELREELGVTMAVDRGLAVDWVSADSLNAPADLRFPGEILHVYDGGTWNDEQIAAVQLPDREITSVEFVEPARLPDLMSPATPAGPCPPCAPASTPLAPPCWRTASRSPPPSLTGPAPFVPHAPNTTSPSTPAPHRSNFRWSRPGGGSSDPTAEPWCCWNRTPARPACPAAPRIPGPRQPTRHPAPGGTGGGAAEFGEPLFLGHLTDPDEPYARLRYAAPLTRLGPPPVDPATGRTHIRVLATLEQALELFDWGIPGADQLAAVHQARARLGIPRAARQPLTELPDATDLTIL
ncbi:NUDIX domain-containing protein [Streptomyces diastatochromogenes]|nr:NUDIX domain-containing protein [Streptomyces diastatochromogenes]